MIVLDKLPTVLDLSGVTPQEAFNLGRHYENFYEWVWDRGTGQKQLNCLLWPLALDDAKLRGIELYVTGWFDDFESILMVSQRTPSA